MSRFIDRVVASTTAQVAARRAAVPDDELAARAPRRAERPFAAALSAPGMSLIAELKRASPSRGAITPDARAGEVVANYARAGAAACSILTEPDHFGGRLEDLVDARAAAGIPLLRKDFIVDEYQLLEARAAGADAALLIVAALTAERLAALIAAADAVGLDALVEVHDLAEVDVAVRAGAGIIGINNRDLATLEVDTETAHRLRPALPAGVISVAESGITSREDVARLERGGVDAILVGETLMRAGDPVRTVAELLGR